MSEIDPRELRNAFGAFMTGVTVVTCLGPDGEPLGFTANSFTSVSLDPPLLLVCLAKSSYSKAEYTSAKGFAVNILAEDQQSISNTFARPVEDRYADIEWFTGPHGAPVFNGVTAWFDCSTHEMVDAGDHILMIGKVEAFDTSDHAPLGYARGGYFSQKLSEQAIEAATAETLRVGALVKNGNALLVIEDEDGLHVPSIPVKRKHGSDSNIDRVAKSLNLTLNRDFVYSVYEDSKAQHLIYRCETDDEEPAEGRFIPIRDIDASGFKDPAEQIMVRRFLSESRLGDFGVYFGDVEQGSVKRFTRDNQLETSFF
jgi:flavin-dependent trigonelline monooxygenase, reductase component